MKKLLEKRRSCWGIGIVAALIFLVVMGTINVNVISNKIAKLNLEKNDSAQAYKVFSNDDKKTQSSNVEFLAFFMNDGRKMDGIDAKVSSGANLYFSLNVMNEGYLKNGKITLSSSNLEFNANIASNAFIDRYYSGSISEINLSDNVNSGNQATFSGKVYKINSKNINDYIGKESVTFTAIYVDSKGNETPISKTIDLNVNWYGELNSMIQQGTQNTKPKFNDDNLELSFCILNKETNCELMLKENVVTAVIPKLNDNSPIDVKINDNNVDYSYDKDSRTLSLKRSALIDSNGSVLKSLTNSNYYNVTVSYPKDSVDSDSTGIINEIVTVTGMYKGYNGKNVVSSNTAKGSIRLYYNPSAENTKITDTITSVDSGYVKPSVPDEKEEIKIPYSFTMSIGKYRQGQPTVLKTDLRAAYNSNTKQECTYEVKWDLETGNEYNINKIIMKEPKNNYGDKFKTTDGKEISVSEFLNISSVRLDPMFRYILNKKSCIKIYDDDTNEVLYKITTKDYNDEYTFDREIKHIRIEVENVDKIYNYNVGVTITKKIDCLNFIKAISIEEFNKIDSIYSYMEGEIELDDGQKDVKRYSAKANYIDKEAHASIMLSEKNVAVSSNMIDETITLITSLEDEYIDTWKNGVFLVEVPKEVIYLELDEIKLVNEQIKGNLTISGYECYKENDRYFIKIYTENEIPDGYDIQIDCKMLLNPTAVTGYSNFELYSFSENGYKYKNPTNDIYDINDNGTSDDFVNLDVGRLYITASKGFQVVQTASNYNENGEINIAPNVANVDRKQNTVDINLQIRNNYDNKLDDVKLLGVIPFENNNHIINNEVLNSEFTTQMTSNGITIPENLTKYIDVYYSTNENATRDLDDQSNGWTLIPDDFSNIKRFLIDFRNYTINVGDTYTFTYTVKLPENVEYNKVSYSAVAAYYSIRTEDGKIDEYSEPSKLGVAITRAYSLDATKFNLENDKRVSKAVYKLTEKNNEKTNDRILVTNAEGKLLTNKLYVGREYSLQEIKTVEGYCLNDDVIKFVVNEGENEELQLKILSDDNFRVDPKIENGVLIGELVDEPRFKLNVVVKDSVTQEIVKNAPFSIEENRFIGNTDGLAEYTYLDKSIEYTLSESDPDEYYGVGDIKFTINYDEKGKYSITSDNDAFKNAELLMGENDDVININVELLNERKPSIIINKTDKVTGEKLKNVIFVLDNGKYFKTNADGEVTIPNISENTTVNLNEIVSNGYYLENIEFTVNKNDEGNISISSTNEDFANAIIVDKDKKIIKVNLTNTPVAKYNLNIEKIGKNGIKLSGAEFALIGQDDEVIHTYKTDSNGSIEISDLFAYVQGRDAYTGVYTLKETKAPSGYANNSEEITFVVEKQADNTLKVNVNNMDSLETVKDVTVNENNVKFLIEDKPVFRLIKKDSENGKLLANAKFVIYEVDDDGNIIDFAKDSNGNYIGTLDENENYVVITDENGSIGLDIKDGKYMSIEIGYPEGYLEDEIVEYFKVQASDTDDSGSDGSAEETESSIPAEPQWPVEPEEPTGEIVEISTIEDLVDLQIAVDGGETYEGKIIKLTRSLNFDDSDSYRDATSTAYGDINADGTINSIKEELTSGAGFIPIGTEAHPFEGTFTGNEFELNNIHIGDRDDVEYNGLFGYVNGGSILDLSISGEINVEGITGAFAGCVNNGKIIRNCINNVNITSTNYTGGIIGNVISCDVVKNCKNYGNVTTKSSYDAGIIGAVYASNNEVEKAIVIKNCENNGIISSNYSAGIIGQFDQDNINMYISDCTNNADINGRSGILGYVNRGKSVYIKNCTNNGNIKGTTDYPAGITNYVGGYLDIYDIRNCENNGQISGGNSTAGLLGYVMCSANIINCRNNGNIDCTNSYRTGGIVATLTDDGNRQKPAPSYNIINTNNYAGFIGNVKSTSTSGEIGGLIAYARCLNINVDNCNNYGKEINVVKGYVGGLFGEISSESGEISIKKSNNYSNIAINYSQNGYIWLGGLIGLLDSPDVGSINKIDNCNNYGDFDLIGVHRAGGLIGHGPFLKELSLTNSNNYGNIDSINGFELGGIFGQVQAKKEYLYNVNNYGDLSLVGKGEGLGGLLAANFSALTIERCSNRGNIVSSNSQYVGGLLGFGSSGSSDIKESYNSGNITCTGNSNLTFIGGIVAYMSTGGISNVYNSGNITYDGQSSGLEIGGIIGRGNDTNGFLKYAYNSGSIINKSTCSGNSNIGGVVGYGYIPLYKVYNAGEINNIQPGVSCLYLGGVYGHNEYNEKSEYVFNSGNITNISSGSSTYVGGISGYGKNMSNVYQAGDLNNDVSGSTCWVGGLYGYMSSDSSVNLENMYLLGNVKSNDNCQNIYRGNIIGYIGASEVNKTNVNYSKNSVIKFLDSTSLAYPKYVLNGEVIDDVSNVGFAYLDTKEFYDILNEEKVWYRINGYNPRLNGANANVKPGNVFEVTNTIKKYKIITNVVERNGVKGGTISGGNEAVCEYVRYDEGNVNDIVITPDEGYKIVNLTIDGNEIQVIPNSDDTYVLPVGYFNNVKKDIIISVEFGKKDRVVTVNKVDKDDHSKGLEGAEFKVEQIDERPEISDEIGELTDNGVQYVEADLDNKEEDVLGEFVANGKEYLEATYKEISDSSIIGALTNNGTYYFKNSSGKYVSSNNSKNNSVSNSYVKIDLSNQKGKYYVKVNAQVSSEAKYDFGYATITQTTTAPAYSSSTGRFIYISGTVAAKDYTSTDLEGGKVYYLHFGYRKDGSGNTGSDTFTINSIKLYGATEEKKVSYNFVKNGEQYVSNNQGKASTIASSYVELDLTDKVGKYFVSVNAEVSSDTNDYGYAFVTSDTTDPGPNSYSGRIMKISGVKEAADYTYTDALVGGKKYYLHFGYSKDSSGNSGNDQFVINSINVYDSMLKTYNFKEVNGKYVSALTPKGKKCSSYIPIDLTNNIGKYTLKINAESSGSYGKYCYISLQDNTEVHSRYDSIDKIVDISGTTSAKDYTTILEGRKKYYLVMVYENTSDDDEKSNCAINNFEISLNTDNFYEGGTFSTDKNGQAKITLPDEGTYIITETKAPKGYILNDDPIRIVVSNGNDNSLTIENEKEKSVTVHHYLKDQEGNYTTVKVADDEVIEKTSDDMEYETFAKHDLKNLDLAKDDNGNYVVPDNASGIIENENIEVNYYYEVQPIKLTVHHYLENSETKLAEDEEKEFEPVVEIEDDRVKSISVDQKYNVSTDEVYNELLQKYELSLIVHDDKIVDTSLLKVANQMLMAIDLNTGDVEDRANVISFTNNSELTYYYSSNDEYTYKVEYYYNNEIDKAKTETGVAKFDDVIDTYADKAGENYTLDRVENLPLLISEDENSNVVKVYYVLKETSKELNYSVEFYVENELQDEDTIEKKVAVDINEPDTIPVEEMELKGKYKGYKVSKIFKDSEEVSVIPTEVESGSVIKVYYTVDEENTKDLSYIVEYYKNDVLQREDTQIVVNTVQILHDNMIEVDKDSINLVDKYPVSKLSSIEKDLVKIDEIPDKVESGSVIRIFYVYDVTKEKRSYTVNYLEKDTNKVLHEAKVVENNRYQDRILSSNEVIDIYGYEYNSVDKDELIIGLNDEENVINVYYTKKDAKVVVSYYEEGTTNKIVDDVEITGKVNDAYKTTPITDIPNKYELVGTPENAEGIMTEDTIYVAYYYRIKDTKLTVKFINKATGEYMYRADGTQETAITSTGKVGSNYSTEPKDYEGFTLVGSTENTSGILTVEPIEVIYYYLQNTRARVQHIDKITGNVMSEESKEGLVGDEFVTSSKDFEGYILVEEPKNKTIIMTETETILKYYYVHVSEGIIEKHVDVITGKILENKVITGNEGDEYEVLPKTFKDYDLVEDRLPTNSKGTMTVGAIEVTYYYVHKAEVVTKYINKATNEKMTENVVQEGHEGDLYTTENKVFDGYKLVEIPENATGTMKAGRIEVTYYYVVNSVTITENHYDINTMEKIAEERRYEGMVGDSYKTSPVEIEGYDLVKEKYPENAEGIIADKPISVDYYYVKKSSVIVKYLDKISGKEVADTIIIEGHEGDEYTTLDKKIVGYKLSGNTENTTGKIGHDTIIVEYYYVRPAKVIVNYIEQATGKELSEKVEMNGYDGEDYVTEAKEIKYYNLVKEPENKAGKYAINVVIDEDGKEIVDDTIIVNYYYEKKNFNLTIDKNINSIIVNGKEQVVNGKLGKVEVYRKELGTAKIQVVYTISVKNIGELAGKATIMESIPRGMKMLPKDNAGWKIENSEATYETGMIEPGKTQDIKVVFVWENAEANIGTIQNIAQIIGTESESGFAQSDEKDDADGADVIVAISTGDSSYVVTMGLILTVLSAGALVVAKKVKE